MTAAISTQVANANPYREIYEQFADDAAFLWLLRSIGVKQPHYTLEDIARLEQRIEAQLDGLMTSPDESWEICSAAMENKEPGEIFVAAVMAFRGLEVSRIQAAVEAGLSDAGGGKGLISALAWLPGRLCHSWIKKFFTSKDFGHKYLAVAACSARREDPRDYLTNIFQRADCLAHPQLYARALRLVGELKRRDLMPVLRIAMGADDPDILFWANWSAVLLGDRSAAGNLQPFALEANPHQDRAIELAFRALPLPEARAWISRLAARPEQTRAVIKASAALGDSQAINWLLVQMQNPALSRIAGEAFSTITGIDLEAQGLALDGLPDLEQQIPNDDPADEEVNMDEDENLPFPDVARVSAVWQKYHSRFAPGQRLVRGRAPSADSLQRLVTSGGQRTRQAAAMELALLSPEQILINTKARARI